MATGTSGQYQSQALTTSITRVVSRPPRSSQQLRATPARAEFPPVAPRSLLTTRQFHRWCAGSPRTTPPRPAGRCRYRGKALQLRSYTNLPPRRSDGLALRPLLQYPVDGIEPIGQRGRTRLQNQRRLDLVQFSVAYRGHRVPTAPCGHLL